MKKKSFLIVVAIVLIAIVGIGTVQYFGEPDGSTLESREELLRGMPKGVVWKIAIEKNMNDHIISGIYSKGNLSGIAVFEPVGSDKYKLQTRVIREQDEIIITGSFIGGKWYDLVWFNGAQTDYAEIIYTIDGHEQELIKHDAKGMDVFVNPAPEKDYSINVVYYDNMGNKYE